ncbi:FHF complex subunit HOOK-interacting protein 1B-like isoform X2 [Physella acuta]|uniref:FHF complex subunit HOOK-interacting protein 1B-like isoform X2 n=1 Tax=Physella acuta TaxID=109671 RepID=UPI0027DD96A9|nr:FHF complex subunit HOOK-interacting protein 1B-like isoform X2 [Physella acuta]
MSWFKRSGERKSPESSTQRSDTDPNTCLEVFQNHWKQACAVINYQDKKSKLSPGQATVDGVETVLSNLEHMVTLLVNEDDDGGLPGPILKWVLASDLFEIFCSWCTINVSIHERLRLQQLRLFELIISQSKQLLLVHKPVIKPLLRLLMDVADSQEISNGELEFKLVLVLHQICICISQQALILESFFSTDTDHGPARFLIFSLLIPYIHREGSVGQRARDALLLIMTLSARHPHIGQYIANNSDFCPVLATGLSGLYSSLPRRINPPSDDWYTITREDCVRIPDLQMFLNSLQFSNAVVQIAHPLVRDQLIHFIYSGFLVPVLAPALHQISREEVMTATAYLDLFIRHVTDPHLLRATLKFILTERYDDILILDSLLQRIHSNSHLSTVTLALFHTLIDLNCEDVMFQLVFRYLVPCNHVMVSQRRSIQDLDLYGKSAEKFLSLRPSCCVQTLPHNPLPVSPAPTSQVVGMTTGPPTQKSTTTTSLPNMITSPDQVPNHQRGETSYFEYLNDARNKLEQTVKACQHWTYLYDGESPPPDSIKNSQTKPKASAAKASNIPKTGYIELGSIAKQTQEEKVTPRSSQPADSSDSNDISLSKEINVKHENNKLMNAVLYSSLEDLDSFIKYLSEVEVDEGGSVSVSESLASLEDLLQAVSSARNRRNSPDPHSRSSNPPEVSATVDSAGVPGSKPSPVDTRGVPKDLPTSPRPTLHGLSTSPMKQTLSPGEVLSPYKSLFFAADEFAAAMPTSPRKQLTYFNDPPNIGPFLGALFSRLELMISNSLYFNLLLTDIIARLAAYPQPLLRSFLLNNTLVFQPTVKSLIQVLSSLRQKLDSFSLSVKQFDMMVVNARQNLVQREDQLFHFFEQGVLGIPPTLLMMPQGVKTRADTIGALVPAKDKKKVTLSELFFRRSPGKGKLVAGSKHHQLQRVQVGGTAAYRYISPQDYAGSGDRSSIGDSYGQSLTTWNAVYCALILDEFLKELAALSQEHSVLHVDEGYLSS